MTALSAREDAQTGLLDPGTSPKTRLIVTDDATYEQRPAGHSNTGAALTEVRRAEKNPGTRLRRRATEWALVDPTQAEPVVGEPWLIAPLHGPWTQTGTVTQIRGELR